MGYISEGFEGGLFLWSDSEGTLFHICCNVCCRIIYYSLLTGLEDFGQDGKYRGKIQVNTALGKTSFSHLNST